MRGKIRIATVIEERSLSSNRQEGIEVTMRKRKTNSSSVRERRRRWQMYGRRQHAQRRRRSKGRDEKHQQRMKGE